MNLTDGEITYIKDNLKEIQSMKGAYDMDRLTHDGNVIKDSAKRATDILKLLEEIEKK